MYNTKEEYPRLYDSLFLPYVLNKLNYLVRDFPVSSNEYILMGSCWWCPVIKVHYLYWRSSPKEFLDYKYQ